MECPDRIEIATMIPGRFGEAMASTCVWFPSPNSACLVLGCVRVCVLPQRLSKGKCIRSILDDRGAFDGQTVFADMPAPKQSSHRTTRLSSRARVRSKDREIREPALDCALPTANPGARSQGATSLRFRTTATAQAPTAPAPQQLLSRRTGCVGVAVVVSACQSQVPHGHSGRRLGCERAHLRPWRSRRPVGERVRPLAPAADRLGPPPSGIRSSRSGPRCSRLFGKPPAKPVRGGARGIGRTGMEEPDHRHRLLLRARRERPDAVAPPRSVMNSRRFTPSMIIPLPVAPLLPTKKGSTSRCGWTLLHCGILGLPGYVG